MHTEQHLFCLVIRVYMWLVGACVGAQILSADWSVSFTESDAVDGAQWEGVKPEVISQLETDLLREKLDHLLVHTESEPLPDPKVKQLHFSLVPQSIFTTFPKYAYHCPQHAPTSSLCIKHFSNKLLNNFIRAKLNKYYGFTLLVYQKYWLLKWFWNCFFQDFEELGKLKEFIRLHPDLEKCFQTHLCKDQSQQFEGGPMKWCWDVWQGV